MPSSVDPLDAGLAVTLTIVFGFITLLILLTAWLGGIGGLADMCPGITMVALLLGGLVLVVVWLRNTVRGTR